MDGDDSGKIVAVEATKRISELFHLENKLDDLTKKEREKQRQQKVKPKVDAFFASISIFIQSIITTKVFFNNPCFYKIV